jgi:hypothetical protein
MEDRIKNIFFKDMSADCKRENLHSEQRHKGFIETRLNYIRKNSNEDEEIMKVDTDLNKLNIDVVQTALSFLSQKHMLHDKNMTRYYLKQLRRELSKLDITNEILLQVFQNGNILLILINFLFDFKNSEIQLETLWILNNLCILCQNHGIQFKDYFYQIHSFLTDFMLMSEKNFSNIGVKNLILEKFFSLIGNIVTTDEGIYHHYLTFNILYHLISNLNSSVRSFRAICLWTLNNILSATYYYNDDNFPKHQECRKIIGQGVGDNRNTLIYIKSLFNRIDPSKNFTECYEFLWFLNYFINLSNSAAVFQLFIAKVDEKVTDNKNFKILLNLLMIDKLHQPVIRILGDLLAIDDGGYENGFKSDIALQILSNSDIICFLSTVLRNNNESFELNYLKKDILWLIKNLLSFDVKNVSSYFYNIIVNFVLSSYSFPTSELKNALIIIYNYLHITGYEDLLKNTKLISFVFNIVENNGVKEDICLRLILTDIITSFIKLKGLNLPMIIELEYKTINNK